MGAVTFPTPTGSTGKGNFAPGITIEKPGVYPLLEVPPSVILRKLASAGPGNALSRPLRTLGRMERTMHTLQWLSDPDLRQRSHAGLNKGEASNSLRRAVFFHRLGEIRDRTLEN